MALLSNFNLVYGTDLRILDPSVEVNASTGIGPQFHLEPVHQMRWVGRFAGSKTVIADHQSIAFRNHKTETMIPHIPIPPWPAGVPLLKTIVADSKCHIYCHNPNVEIEGQAVGIAMLLLAPPFHCASIPLPASIDGLAQIADKIPGLAKVKAALGGLHKLNGHLAKLDAAGKRVQQVVQGARVAQILGSAAVDMIEAIASGQDDQIGQDGQDGRDGQGGQEGRDGKESVPEEQPFHASQELLVADADYAKAKRAVEQSGKPGVEHYARAQQIATIEKHLHQQGHEMRSKRADYDSSYEQALEVSNAQRSLDAKLDRHRQHQQRLAEQIADAKRRHRLGTPSKLKELQGAMDGAKSQGQELAAARARCATLRAEIQQRVDRLQRTIEQDLETSHQARKRLRSLKRDQDRALAQLPTPGSHKDLAVMLPSLTSFCASFFGHSVKVGMSASSYWKMQLKVLAIVSADLIDHGVGLVADALLVDGPSSRIGSWVAELGAGAFSGLLGSKMLAFGQDAPLDFSVPIKTGSLFAGGLIEARAEFYWSHTEGNDAHPDASSQPVASRFGINAPGRDLDTVTVHNADQAAAIDLEIPTVW